MDDKLPQEFRERAFRFTLKLFDYCAELGRIPGPTRCVGDQLFDAGSSIGANLAESKGSYSRKELAAKTRSRSRKATNPSTGCPSRRRNFWGTRDCVHGFFERPTNSVQCWRSASDGWRRRVNETNHPSLTTRL